MALRVCFIGGTRYDRPLNATSEKKFRAMKSLAELFVIGFSRDMQARRFTEHAHFYLLPQLPLPFLRYIELFILGQIVLFCLIVRHRIGVVVAQSPYEGFIAALAIKFAACLGYHARLVVEAHGDFERSLFLYREVRFAGLYRFLMNRLARFAIKHADLLRAVSNSTKDQLKQWAPDTTVVQFRTWTDIDTFLQAGKVKNDVTEAVIYAGVVNPLKGIHHLIQAFSLVAREFPSVQLLIAGNKENKSYLGDLVEQVKKLRLADRVRFMGAMRQPELASSVANALVLVLPSLSEGLPRVIVEAMATGTPVIASRVGGIPELVEDGVRGFLVPPGDQKLLAEKLSWILNNPDKARKMGEQGRVFAERVFSTESYLAGYEQIFAVGQLRNGKIEHATSAL